MRNFGRALRASLKYPWSLTGAVLCSLLVAISWGGNIAAVGPIVQVLFDEDGGQSLHDWIDGQITTTEQRVAEFQGELQAVEQGAGAAPDSDGVPRDEILRTRLKAEQAALAGYHRMKPWIVNYLPDDAFQTLALMIGILVIATIIKGVCVVLGNVLTERVAQGTSMDLRSEFFSRTLELDMAAFTSAPPSDWISRMTNDMTSVTAGLRTFYGRAIREPLKAGVCVAGAMFICWRLFVVSLIAAPISMFLIQKLTISLKRASRRLLEEVSELFNVLTETFGSLKVVKAYTMERCERERFQRNADLLYKKHMRIAWYSSLIRPASEMMGIMIVAMALLCGAYMLLNRETHLLGVIPICDRPLSLTKLMVFFGFLAGISDPARKLADVIGQIQTGAAACDRVFGMLERETKVTDPATPQPVARHHRDIVFKGVDFHYAPGQSVLSQVHLRIPFGETLAIVGPNGCGKSTLANLVLRLYDPVAGAVLIDGVDVRDVKRGDLRSQIGLVTQEAVLFDDTVCNNIRYGSPHATDAQVEAAARKAHAHRFISEKLEHGYQTQVGSHGCRLSGGQRQRISLARAILRDPSILILDEATSQVDLESEQLIHQTLSQFVRNRTTLIITHRMSVLSLANRIVVMDHGQIKDQGTHHELIQRCDVFQRLYQADFRQTA